MRKFTFFSKEERLGRHLELAAILPLGHTGITARFTSSNLVTSVDQYRQSYQYSSTVDGLMKDVYIPALNNTTFQATPLMAMFGEFGGRIDFKGNRIIKAFKHQGAGGFGGISEGGDFVKGRNQKGFQGWTRIKFLNAFFSLTGPAARTVKVGEGAYVDSVSDAMEDTLSLAKMQMERMIGGAGDGELCRVAIATTVAEAAMATGEYVPIDATASSSTFAAATHTHTAASGGAYSIVQWLQPGLRVNLVADASFDAPPLATAELIGPFEVGHVDYAANTFSLKYLGTAALDFATAFANDTAVLILEKAYGETESAGGDSGTDFNCLELNGLYNLVSDGVDYSGTNGVDESATKYANIWNRTRSTYPHALKSTVKDAGDAELDEELLIRWVLDLVNIKQSIPNVLVTDPLSRLKYFGNRKEDRRFDTTVMDTMFGFRSIGVVIDQYNLILQSLTSMKLGTLFMLNTAAFKFAKATNGFEWIEDGGRLLRNYETKDGMFGTAINYCEFVCEDPKGQLKAFDISYAAG